VYRGRLNYLLFGRRVEKVKRWLHRITAPPAPAAKPEPEPEAGPTEDIALHRSYQYDPPPATEPEPTPPPEPAKPPEAEAPPTATPEADAPDDSAPAVSHPTPPPEGDNYNEDEEYMRHMANTDEGPQPGAVDADDLLVLLSVFSKGKSATPQEIATARRAMRAVSGSQIEQSILDQLNGKDGYVAVMLDMITKDLHAEDDTPPRENKKSDRAFRLEDFV
jgi:outer membrane biosynthesis protein TonB